MIKVNEKAIHFFSEIGAIMYVGGILSHIVIGALFGHAEPKTMVIVMTYKMMSAYILILPGLGLKLLSDFLLYQHFDRIPWWFRIKTAAMVFLTINAFIFLVPMMPELLNLAEASVVVGHLSEAYLEKAALEGMIGASNAIPLLIEVVLSSTQPKLFGERKQN